MKVLRINCIVLAINFLFINLGFSQTKELTFPGKGSTSIKASFSYNITNIKSIGDRRFILLNPKEQVKITFSEIKVPGDGVLWCIYNGSPLQIGRTGEQEYVSIPFETKIINLGEFKLLINEDTTKSDSPAIVIQLEQKPEEGSPVSGEVEDKSQTDLPTEEEKVWESVRKKDNCKDYCSFVNENQQSAYLRDAKKRCAACLPMEVEDNKGENKGEFTYIIKNLSVKPKLSPGSGVKIEDDYFYDDEFKYTFKAVVQDPEGDLSLEICDNESPSRKEISCISIQVDNILEANWKWNTSEDSILVDITGGVPPYRFEYKRNDLEEFTQFGIGGDTAIALADLENAVPVSGKYEIVIRDVNNKVKKVEGNFLEIKKPIMPKWALNALLYGGILVLLLLIIWIIFYIRKKQKEKEYREYARINIENRNEEILNPIREKEATDSLPVITITARSKKKGEESWDLFNDKRNQFPYMPISMDNLWADTMVDKIFISQEAVISIDSFINKDNIDLIPTMGSNIPEIGGMLMGNYCDKKTSDLHNSYLVSVEKFIPITAKRQNAYQLEFNIDSVVNKVAEVQDDYPNLQLVGWFHTHPGHGVFLSAPDIRSQEQFTHPYQFAMVIDTCDENLETGFFTWKSNMSINNKVDLKDGAGWYSWLEIEKLKRRKK